MLKKLILLFGIILLLPLVLAETTFVEGKNFITGQNPAGTGGASGGNMDCYKKINNSCVYQGSYYYCPTGIFSLTTCEYLLDEIPEEEKTKIEAILDILFDEETTQKIQNFTGDIVQDIEKKGLTPTKVVLILLGLFILWLILKKINKQK